MADKFELSTRQWVPSEPQITIPEEGIERAAWEELNERARTTRKIYREHGLNGAFSALAGEVVVVAETGNPVNATEQFPETPSK